MSKLSRAAWRRNGLMGRLTWVRNNLKQIIDEKWLTNAERNDIDDALEAISNILDQKEKRWSRIKRKHRKELKD